MTRNQELCAECTMSNSTPIKNLPPFERKYLEFMSSNPDPWQNARDIMISNRPIARLLRFVDRDPNFISPTGLSFVNRIYMLMYLRFLQNPSLEKRKRILIIQIRKYFERIAMELTAQDIVRKRLETLRSNTINAKLQYVDLGRTPNGCQECGICGVPYGVHDGGKIEYPVTLLCDEKHVFGNICIHQWLVTNSTCPLDRKQIAPPQVRRAPNFPILDCPWWVIELAGGRHPCNYHSFRENNFDWVRFAAEAPPARVEQPTRQEEGNDQSEGEGDEKDSYMEEDDYLRLEGP